MYYGDHHDNDRTAVLAMVNIIVTTPVSRLLYTLPNESFSFLPSFTKLDVINGFSFQCADVNHGSFHMLIEGILRGPFKHYVL